MYREMERWGREKKNEKELERRREMEKGRERECFESLQHRVSSQEAQGQKQADMLQCQHRSFSFTGPYRTMCSPSEDRRTMCSPSQHKSTETAKPSSFVMCRFEIFRGYTFIH